MGWLLASLRRLRLERAATAGTVLLILATSFVFAMAPRALDAVGDQALHDQVASARSADRNIQLVQQDRIDAAAARADDPGAVLSAVARRGEAAVARLPRSVRDLIADSGITVVTPRYQVFRPLVSDEFVRLRYESGAADLTRLVEGRLPTGATRRVDHVGPDETSDVLAVEVAVSRRTAAAFDLDVGDTVELTIDKTDPLVGRGGPDAVAAVDVVGIYDLDDPDADVWMNDPILDHPTVRWAGGDVYYLDADVLVAPDAYPALLAATSFSHDPMRYTWRYYIDPGRLDSATIGALLVDLRRAQATYPSANVTFGSDTAMRAGLLRLVERQRAEWRAAESILTVVAIGPAAVAIAALGLVTLLAAQRRRQAMALARSRGASAGQVVVAAAVEGVLLAVPAAGLAALAAVALVPDGPGPATAIAAAAVALAAVVLVMAASLAGTGAGTARGGPSRASGPRRLGPRRLVLEGGVVVLAGGGAWLLRERGLRGASSAGELAAADPLVAAVPALAGIAAAIVVVRLYPVPLRGLAWLAARRRGLVPVHAMRRSARGGLGGPLLAVLLATVAIGAFSAAALAHLEQASALVAWQSVGAPYRLSPPGNIFPVGFDAASLPGVEAKADVFRQAMQLRGSGPRHEFIAVDVPAYEAVVGGTPADPHFPDALRAANAEPGGPIPVIVSRSLSERPDGVQVGDVFPVTIESTHLRLVAVEVRDSFPAVEPDFHFIIAPAGQIRAAAPGLRLFPSSAVILAPRSAAGSIRQAAEAALPGSNLEDRAAVTAEIRDSPSVEAIRTGIGLSATVAAVYAALAVAAALALAGLLRAIEVAHLRTLGLTRGEAFGLVVVEHGPTLLAAAGIGLAFGVGLFALLLPGLGLEGLVGAEIDVPVTVDGSGVAVILGAILAVVMVALSLGAIFQRNAAPVAAVRRGFE